MILILLRYIMGTVVLRQCNSCLQTDQDHCL
nr:MAG TPA: hypothetical protein [Caudoviricetes sp.]